MNQSKGSLTDTMVKLVLIFFISLLSFSVGTVVGQYFAEGQRKYTSLEADYNSHRETASVSAGANEVKPEEALTDEDIANLTEEFVKSEKEKGKDIMKRDVAEAKEGHGEHGSKEAAHGAKEAAHGAKEKEAEHADEGKRTVKVVGAGSKAKAQEAEHGAKAPAHESKEEPAHEPKAEKKHEAKSAPVQEAAERVAHGEVPTKAPQAEKRTPTSLPAVTTNSSVGKYTVQVAAYATEAEAQKRVASLKERGFSAFSVTAQKNGKNWYRVGVGLYSTMQDATSARQDLAKQTDLKEAFVQKIVE